MSYAIGQSQTPWDTSVSEVDLPANMHFSRMGPVGQMPNPLEFIKQFIPGAQQQVAPPPEDPVAKAMPFILGGTLVFLGAVWYITKKK